MKAARWLKWDNTVIGTIDGANFVQFAVPKANPSAALERMVAIYTQNKGFWTPQEFSAFLFERIVSPSRRDIEKILFRLGLVEYDAFQIGELTRAINAKDLFWLAKSEDEKLSDAQSEAFKSIFSSRIDLPSDLNSPEGCNIKRYGVYQGQYGIYKRRLSPLTTDVESETAVYLLAQRLGIPCCPAFRTSKDYVFSAFLYDYPHEHIVPFHRLSHDSTYNGLVTARPQFRDDLARMILLDFITRQDDRHLLNFAAKVDATGESFYPLYDNGRSLFYEDSEELVDQAIADPALYATSFGNAGTYWDYAQEIALESEGLPALALDLPRNEIEGILESSGFSGYRLRGATVWIEKALRMIKELCR
ncbi:MAG: hypothetical protein LBC41_03905 [Clostridiales bacterium]|jgi:hypothetical protein|nr:hypothetical protein [Clostridiales bacterium]MDR2749785.1 hypothetical protein [Clostridiales bacterium]